MVESLNQIVETSFTLRSVRWRIEAFRTGKSYGEIALLRSLLYRVEQVFLIHRQTGLLMQHVIADAAVVRDPDMVSAMLTAIQDFVRDSFGEGDEALETLRVGEVSVWIQHGPEAILAGVVRGMAPSQLRNVFSSALEAIQRDFGDRIAAFAGDAMALEPAQPAMRTCLIGRSPERRRSSLFPAYLVLGVVLVAILGWIATSVRDQRRWETYLSLIREEPGIAIVDQGKRGGQYRISGLRDPLARDPAELLQPAGLSAQDVAFYWQPYISLSPEIAAKREQLELKRAIEQQTIRFQPGRSSFGDEAADAVDSVGAFIAQLFAATRPNLVRVELTGHTDERGTEQINARLGSDRASEVAAALVGRGVDPARLSIRSAGSAEPVRPGHSERDRSFNRSVTFRVVSNPQ
jgi:outer membrane protein OmpA-like peptidoglycan-associated protein